MASNLLLYLRKSNLVEALSKQKSFESNEGIMDSFSGDRISSEFPLFPHSSDYSDTKFSQSLGLNRRMFLRLLEASFTGNDNIFSEGGIFPEEVINRLDSSQGASPLHYACMNGHLSVVTRLLEHGADVDIWDENKTATPLICAAVYGHLEIVELLLNHGCDINAGLNEQSSALLWSVRRSHASIVHCLLDHGACQTSTVLYSETPVHAAVICGSPAILEMIVTAVGFTKSDFRMGHQKDTPLHLAASGEYSNSFEACKILLEKGNASLNVTNSSGKTPLHLAAASYEVDVVKLLLSHGASSNFVDDASRTPLFYMISDAGESLKCLKALCVEGKCDVNYQDDQGYTALHVAAFKEAVAAARILLLNGADFSLKTHDGFSALSILIRKVPNTEKLISRVFDNAVKVSNQHESINEETQTVSQNRQNYKVKVNFNCVVSSPSITCKSTNQAAAADKYSQPETTSSTVRKETAKIKCLIDENQANLLLHPVVHSFLVLKWHKARPIFLATVFFKAILVVLFTAYVQFPYVLNQKPANSADDIPSWYPFLYAAIVTLATLNGIMEIWVILRSPKSQLRSLEPWIFVSMLLIMIAYMRPNTWGKTEDLFHRSMAATGICLAWMDMWMYMGRFPTFGLSIRVFFKVLQNFAVFIAPHFCMLAGFVISFTLLFPKTAEFSSIVMTMAKAIRIMAGDNELPDKFKDKPVATQDTKEIISYFLTIWIYTAYVLTVGIVLMNMLIGLAVNDIQGIYAQASINRLSKQTILLNTLDANFNGRWVRSWIPKKFLARYVNLFSSSSFQNKILTFKPYDTRDTKLSSELKLALVNVANNNGNKIGIPSELLSDGATASSSLNVQRWMDAVKKTMAKKDSEQEILIKKVNVLVDRVNLLVEAINNEANKQ